jgi:hypothetical protein
MQISKAMVTGLAVLIGAAVFTIATPVSSAHAAMCPWDWKPVCGMTKDQMKRTYPNACVAKEDGAKHIRDGACKK